MIARSTARVVTDRPRRYAKHLAAHFGRRIETSWDEVSGQGYLVFPHGTGTLTAEPDALLLRVEGEAQHLGGLEDVVGRHLVRFGAKDELFVQWQRDSGAAGSTHRHHGDAHDEHPQQAEA